MKATSRNRDYAGPNNPKWKNGTITDSREGRLKVASPDHPFAVQGYVYEYRIVAEKRSADT